MTADFALWRCRNRGQWS